jgi:hypothetical protein
MISLIDPERSVSLALLQMLSGDGRRYLAVIEAYIDEGGTHSGSPILSVAAYGGAHEQWVEFLSLWGNQPFHARVDHALKPKLFNVIERCQLEAVVAWVDPKDFDKHAALELKRSLGNAYAVCAFACALQLQKLANQNSVGPISFVIEKGQPNGEYIERVLKSVSAEENSGIAAVALADKRDFVQLITADFLAHSRSTSNDWYRRLTEAGGVAAFHITPRRLEKISSQIEEMAKKYRYARDKRRKLARLKRKSGWKKFSTDQRP